MVPEIRGVYPGGELWFQGIKPPGAMFLSTLQHLNRRRTHLAALSGLSLFFFFFFFFFQSARTNYFPSRRPTRPSPPNQRKQHARAVAVLTKPRGDHHALSIHGSDSFPSSIWIPGGSGVELDSALIAVLRRFWIFPWPVFWVRYGWGVEKRK